LGDFALAVEHFEKAVALYDTKRHLDDVFRYAQNPGVAMRCFAAWALWFLGRPDQSLIRMHEALTFARVLTEPHGRAHALFFAATLHQLRREPSKAREYAQAAITVSTEHGLMLYQAMARIVHGWTLIDEGRVQEAIQQIRQGIAAHQATGTQLLRPHFLALLAEALNRAGQRDEALRTLDEALAVANRNSERTYLSELHRLKRELSAQSGVGLNK
jgi:predicted ATPase